MHNPHRPRSPASSPHTPRRRLRPKAPGAKAEPGAGRAASPPCRSRPRAGPRVPAVRWRRCGREVSLPGRGRPLPPVPSATGRRSALRGGAGRGCRAGAGQRRGEAPPLGAASSAAFPRRCQEAAAAPAESGWWPRRCRAAVAMAMAMAAPSSQAQQPLRCGVRLLFLSEELLAGLRLASPCQKALQLELQPGEDAKLILTDGKVPPSRVGFVAVRTEPGRAPEGVRRGRGGSDSPRGGG